MPNTDFPFVIQQHEDSAGCHWDLMLSYFLPSANEEKSVLATWKFSVCPSGETVNKILTATRLPDHRNLYLTYEGEISSGRGSCKIVEKGIYQPITISPEKWEINLFGQNLTGSFILKKLSSDNEWTLEKILQ
jgi:hypothetical protein